MITNTRICPVCGYDTEVFDSRYNERSGFVLRNRRCLECGKKFKTVEIDSELFKRLTKTNEIMNKIIDFLEKGEKIERETETTC